ncbi:MAG: type II toxin-antitoxin system RelE/ParE family toxin [Thermaerobacter sp.]|nr:type II toxin-antitoxin system RelE/ParE family toxin [Thermaerobacter sp.]
MQEIIFYRSPGGRSPVQEFLDDLEARHAGKVTRAIGLVRANWPSIGMPHVEKLCDDIWELRTPSRGGTCRILFSVDPDNKAIIFLHGIMKKSTKFPENDIRIAVQRLRDFVSRRGSGG